MPAASESTAADTLAISVDSATTEEDKTKPSASSSSRLPRKRSSSAPKTTSFVATVVGKSKDEGRRETSVQDGDAMSANYSEGKRS